MPARPNWGGLSWLGKPPDPTENSRKFARVGVLLGPADLATIDALIVAGVVASPRGSPAVGGEPYARAPRGELLATRVARTSGAPP